MKKEIRRFKVPFYINWDYGITVEQIRKDLDELEKLGAKEIDINAAEEYGSVSVTIEAFSKREETDEEFEERINQQKQRQEEIKARDLLILERIKLKYGI